jgi:hypothetical protein
VENEWNEKIPHDNDDGNDDAADDDANAGATK